MIMLNISKSLYPILLIKIICRPQSVRFAVADGTVLPLFYHKYRKKGIAIIRIGQETLENRSILGKQNENVLKLKFYGKIRGFKVDSIPLFIV